MKIPHTEAPSTPSTRPQEEREAFMADMIDSRKRRNQRLDDLLRPLIAAGNMSALIASDPDRFDVATRRDVVAAWNAAAARLRDTDRKEST